MTLRMFPAYGTTSALVRWTNVEAPYGYQVTYQLYFQAEGSSEWKLVYSGSNLETRVRDLQPYTRYLIALRCSNDVEQGPPSEPTLLRTEEAIPSAPSDLHAATVTTNQVRLIWSPPIHLNGSLHHYTVRVAQYYDFIFQWESFSVGDLDEKFKWKFRVSAVNGKGTGPAATLSLQTLETGPHWPEKPVVTVLGRSEVTLNWEPPKYTRGRIMRYEVYMNQGKSPVYSGTEQHCRLIGLRPDTEYTFVVAMITNEGKFESKPVKRKTAKDGLFFSDGLTYKSPQVDSRHVTCEIGYTRREVVDGNVVTTDILEGYAEAEFHVVNTFSINPAMHRVCSNSDFGTAQGKNHFDRARKPWQYPSPRTPVTLTANSTLVPNRPLRGAISRVDLLAAYSRAAIYLTSGLVAACFDTVDVGLYDKYTVSYS
ncbi:usherin [Clonorchis sinensis]|uniref:Usherin n=1 Tax=Clonorchis sinensis TaxID=79923 RepID=G7YBD2_CLOSI|nr:usherin [Clonorchis sinensis]